MTALGSYDSRAATAESSYLRLVTIAEAFTDALSVSVLQGVAQPEERLLGLIAQYELRAAEPVNKNESVPCKASQRSR